MIRTARPGFTLIELIITVAILSILATIAYPSYQAYIVRTNESVAKAFLGDMANRQQSFYNDRRRFADNLSDLGYVADTISLGRDGQQAGEGAIAIYNIDVVEGSATARTYILQAIPVGNQATRSQCGTLTVDAKGTRAATGPKGDACWQR